MRPLGKRAQGIAVLASGGLDSCVMLAELAKFSEPVYPIYVRCGLFWEETELRFLRDFVSTVGDPRILEPRSLEFPMDDIYSGQWQTTGTGIPGYYEADERWKIPGRNLILISKTAVWCKLHDVGQIGLGTLGSNPFSDATPEFFASLGKALSMGLDLGLEIICPFAELTKPDVIRLGSHLPLERTLSCARPQESRHCGVCGKCHERTDAFLQAGVKDPTAYASEPPTWA